MTKDTDSIEITLSRKTTLEIASILLVGVLILQVWGIFVAPPTIVASSVTASSSGSPAVSASGSVGGTPTVSAPPVSSGMVGGC